MGQDFGEACVRDFGRPYTQDGAVLELLRIRASIAGEVYYDWGNSTGYLMTCLWPILNSVVHANREMLTDAGIELPREEPKYELTSPVLDFRDLRFFRRDSAISTYHDRLEAIAYHDITGFGAADQVGEEWIVTFPAWYDVWLQAVVGWGNALAILQELQGE